MAFEIIKCVIDMAAQCYAVAQEVKSFKKASELLAERIKLVTEPIELADTNELKSVHPNAYDRFLNALKKLRTCIKNIHDFFQKLAEMDYICKVLNKNTISDNFNDFNAILDGLVPGLILILQLEQREEIIQKFQQLEIMEDNQQAIKDGLEQLRSDIQGTAQGNEEILYILHEMQKSLPGKSKVPPDLKEIALQDLEQMKHHGGEGMIGQLYFANYKQFGGMVAVKKLEESEDIRKHLKEEAKLLKKFKSPHIVELWGICVEGPNNMIVFEYMKHGNLRKVLDESPPELTDARRLRMATEGALGLYRIHNLEWLHRALTSMKFLVDQDFRVKLSDVGLSKTWESAGRHSVQVKQKQYHAPELLKDSEKKYDYKCEIYCFGIVLWEIFTGKEPYEGMDQIEIMRSVKKGEKLTIPDDIGSSGKIISRCMEDDPLTRPSISEIVDELRACEREKEHGV